MLEQREAGLAEPSGAPGPIDAGPDRAREWIGPPDGSAGHEHARLKRQTWRRPGVVPRRAGSVRRSRQQRADEVEAVIVSLDVDGAGHALRHEPR